MISYLKGKLVNYISGKAVVDVNGVGYGVWVGEKIKEKIKAEEFLSLFIHTHVREDALDLYGFTSKEELELFQLLLTVSGVGPKTGLIIIDQGVTAIRQAILKGDVGFFMTIPRIGKKNAQKIIIELKSKLGSLEEFDLKQGGETQALLAALQNMGYSREEAMRAVRQLPND
ncbi:Holliday junction DNA helicase RuvA, partial [Candidatus Beckwithbacteria bacterium RBG_13_42_9]